MATDGDDDLRARLPGLFARLYVSAADLAAWVMLERRDCRGAEPAELVAVIDALAESLEWARAGATAEELERLLAPRGVAPPRGPG